MPHPPRGTTIDRLAVYIPTDRRQALAAGVVALLSDDRLRSQLGENAARDARRRFDLNLQAETYVHWYQEIIARWDPSASEHRQANIAISRGTSHALSKPG